MNQTTALVEWTTVVGSVIKPIECPGSTVWTGHVETIALIGGWSVTNYYPAENIGPPIRTLGLATA